MDKTFYEREKELLSKLVNPRRNWCPTRPKIEAPPKAPPEFYLTYEEIYTTSDRELDLMDVVNSSLAQAGYTGPIPPEIKQAFERTSIRITRNYHEDDIDVSVLWEYKKRNELHSEQRTAFLEEMKAYNKVAEEKLAALEIWVNDQNTGQNILQELKDRAEYERLKSKFEK